jgi:hypothetical protein
MTNPMLTIHNVETGEIIEREMTAAEKTAFDSAAQEYVDKEKNKADKAAARVAVYAKLGLTADEIAALAD